MEKEPQPESLADVTIKPDYPPSEVYSSEPPPAYQRPQSSAIQVARIIAFTVVVVSIILGGFMLASAYVSANASCKQLEQELQFLTDSVDRIQPLQPEALIQDDQKADHEATEKATSENASTKQPVEEPQDSSSSEENDEADQIAMKLKLPMQIILNELADVLAEKQERQETNCIIEKRVSEQLVDRAPQMPRFPFGFGRPDARQEHITGEKIIIICKAGNGERKPEVREETMIHPILIPIPPQQFHSHMPQQMPPAFGFQQRFRPMENMYPPMQEQTNEDRVQNFPPNPIIQHIIQHIIAQKLQSEAMKYQEVPQDISQQPAMEPQMQYPPNRNYEMMRNVKLPIPEEILQQVDRLPHNGGVIIAVSEQEPKGQQEMQNTPQESNQNDANFKPMPIQFAMMPESPVQDNSQFSEQEPKAEQNRGVIIAVSEHEPKVSEEMSQNIQDNNQNIENDNTKTVPVQFPVIPQVIQQAQTSEDMSYLQPSSEKQQN